MNNKWKDRKSESPEDRKKEQKSMSILSDFRTSGLSDYSSSRRMQKIVNICNRVKASVVVLLEATFGYRCSDGETPTP